MVYFEQAERHRLNSYIAIPNAAYLRIVCNQKQGIIVTSRVHQQQNPNTRKCKRGNERPRSIIIRGNQTHCLSGAISLFGGASERIWFGMLNLYTSHSSTPNLVPGLNLVVTCNDLSIRRRHSTIRAPLAVPSTRDPLLLRRRPRRLPSSLRPVVGSLRLLLILVLRLSTAHVRAVDDDVAHPLAAAAIAAALGVVVRDRVVVVVLVGELGDDVPGVDEAGDVAQEQEEDVDDGVGAAEAALDPDWTGCQ